MILHSRHGAPVIGTYGVVVEVIGHGLGEVGNNNHVRIPLIDLLHGDYRVGIVGSDAVGHVDGTYRVAPPLAEEAGAGGDHLLVVILEQEQNLLPLFFRNIRGLFLNAVIDLAAVRGNLFHLSFFRINLAQKADPLVIGLDAVIFPLGGGYAHGGQARIFQLFSQGLVACVVEDNLGLHGKEGLHIHILAVHNIGPHIQNLRIKLGQDAVLRRIHAGRLHGLNGLRRIQEYGQHRRQRQNVENDDIVRIRGHGHRAVRVIGDGDGSCCLCSILCAFRFSLFGAFCFCFCALSGSLCGSLRGGRLGRRLASASCEAGHRQCHARQYCK